MGESRKVCCAQSVRGTTIELCTMRADVVASIVGEEETSSSVVLKSTKCLGNNC